MKKLLFAVAALLIGFQAFAQEAEVQQESKKSPLIPSYIGLTAELTDGYMSDGMMVNPDRMIFGDLWVEWQLNKNFTLEGDLWIANDWNKYNRYDGVSGEPEEIDYSIGLKYSVSNYSIDLTYAYWDMPKRTGWNHPGSTKMKLVLTQKYEIELDKNLKLTPVFMVGNDFENDEWQAKLGVEAKWEIKKNLNMKTTADLFWANGRWLVGADTGKDAGDLYKNTFTTFVLGTELMYKIPTDFGDYSFGPFAKVAAALDHEVRDAWKSPYTANSKSGYNTLVGIRLVAEF